MRSAASSPSSCRGLRITVRASGLDRKSRAARSAVLLAQCLAFIGPFLGYLAELLAARTVVVTGNDRPMPAESLAGPRRRPHDEIAFLVQPDGYLSVRQVRAARQDSRAADIVADFQAHLRDRQRVRNC